MRLWLLKEMCTTGCLEHRGMLIRVSLGGNSAYLCRQALPSQRRKLRPEGQCLASGPQPCGGQAARWASLLGTRLQSPMLWPALQHLARWDVKGHITGDASGHTQGRTAPPWAL